MEVSINRFPCPGCRHARRALESECLGCGWQPLPTRQAPEPLPEVTPIKMVKMTGPISIASLMLVTLAAALGAAAVAFEPFSGSFVSMAIFFSLIRVVQTNLQAKVLRGPLSPQQKVECFLASFLLVVFIPLASLLAFFTVLMAIAAVAISTGGGSSGALFVGAIVAILVAVSLICRLWPPADYEPRK